MTVSHSTLCCKSFNFELGLKTSSEKGCGRLTIYYVTTLFYCNRRTFQIACAILEDWRKSEFEIIAAAENRWDSLRIF